MPEPVYIESLGRGPNARISLALGPRRASGRYLGGTVAYPVSFHSQNPSFLTLPSLHRARSPCAMPN